MCIAAAIGGAAVLGAGASVYAADSQKSAAKTQANAITAGTQSAEAINQPFVQGGETALGQLTKGEAPGGTLNQNFTLADFKQDPGYQFDLAQGNLAVQRSAAASGILDSGGTLKSIANYTQGEASNEFNNAYQRYTTSTQNNTANLLSTAGLGQASANNSAAMVQNGTAAAGASLASGTVGAANSLTSGTNGLSNLAVQYSGLNTLSSFNNGSNNSAVNSNLSYPNEATTNSGTLANYANGSGGTGFSF